MWPFDILARRRQQRAIEEQRRQLRSAQSRQTPYSGNWGTPVNRRDDHNHHTTYPVYVGPAYVGDTPSRCDSSSSYGSSSSYDSGGSDSGGSCGGGD